MDDHCSNCFELDEPYAVVAAEYYQFDKPISLMIDGSVANLRPAEACGRFVVVSGQRYSRLEHAPF